MAVSLRSSIAKRCSHLNAALVASGKNAAKSEYLGLMYRAILLCFVSGRGLLKLFSIFSIVVFLPFQTQMYSLKVSFVTLSFQKVFLVLLASFLRRCKFQVVSVTGALKLRLN
ncbi:hypothetical protein G6Z94_18000 [Vibrio aestuarianus]|uniref:hypothetical protein n=1 Tax=Vibrio aestuarianus TaxID=28171 RepID=UPI001592CFBE|nr:hypothetical protein [Vibrio aestuarianus]NGZ19189.1 hypothetical protein [Vibrio aestuarianus]